MAGVFHDLQFFEPVVEVDLVDDGFDQDVHVRAFGIVGRADVAYAVVMDQRGHLLAGTLLVGVVDRDRMSAGIFHQPHAGDVGRPVAHVDHVLERHGTFVFGDVTVHHLAVEHRFDAFVDLEDELRLVGVVDRHGGPVGDAVDVVEKRAGIDLPELVCDLSSFDDLLHP